MSVNLSLHTSKSELFSTTSKPNWYVVYTKPRHEFKVNERLTIMGLSTYCPSITKVSQWSDRKKKIKTPALPSMILVNIKENERDMVFDCSGVVRYMFSIKR